MTKCKCKCNAQRYHDEIRRPIVVPFIHDHHLMLQHDNARPHVARISTQFLEAKNIPVLAWPAYSPDMSLIEQFLGCSGSTYTTACSSSYQYQATSHSHWREVDQHYTGHNQQPDQLYVKEMCCTSVRQMVVTPDTDTGFRSVSAPPKCVKITHLTANQQSIGHSQQPDQLYVKEMCCTSVRQMVVTPDTDTGFRSVSAPQMCKNYTLNCKPNVLFSENNCM